LHAHLGGGLVALDIAGLFFGGLHGFVGGGGRFRRQTRGGDGAGKKIWVSSSSSGPWATYKNAALMKSVPAIPQAPVRIL
jgi:hypothetical protein